MCPFSVALVDCDQKTADVTHLMDDEKYVVDTGEPKASICRKTYQFGRKYIYIDFEKFTSHFLKYITHT